MDLENRLNIGVDGDVRLRKTVDLIARAGGALKMEEAADVVVLVEGAENTFDFLPRKSQRIERHGFSVAARNRQIFSDNFLQFHMCDSATANRPAGVSTGYRSRLSDRLARHDSHGADRTRGDCVSAFVSPKAFGYH